MKTKGLTLIRFLNQGRRILYLGVVQVQSLTTTCCVEVFLIST